MISTLLHVEDDPMLGAIVQLQFESLGFRGRHLSAATLREGEKILDDLIAAHSDVDLIISDMHLPDGTGLDLVRWMRSKDALRSTPMLILSGDVDKKKVGRAYALGANAYIDKSPAGTTLTEVVSVLYRHWVRDVVGPPAQASDRIEQFFSRALSLRGRYAQLYQRISEQFVDKPSESCFWLGRSLCESNLTNLIAFLRRSVDEEHFPEAFVAQMERMQQVNEKHLSVAERQLERGSMTPSDIYHVVVDMLEAVPFDTLAESVSYMFPVVPVATAALRDFSISYVLDVTAWIDVHAGGDTALRERVAQLRSGALSELAIADAVDRADLRRLQMGA